MKESYTLKLEGKEWKDCLKEAYNKKKKDVFFSDERRKRHEQQKNSERKSYRLENRHVL